MINFLLKDLTDINNDYKTRKFFFRDITSQLIYLIILQKHVKEEICNLEVLFNDLCPKFSSRNTVKKIISNAIAKNFIIKVNSLNDRRISDYRPSLLMINEYELWGKNYVKNFKKYIN